ncbi:alpha/beta fold hydrolase [Nonomuraea indica]|uniref:Alpha/beta fold hydrolase n=1 Tax=Nonomuraea indica TaxID=1581193 RepID=A0ABW8ADP4_9ACTN
MPQRDAQPIARRTVMGNFRARREAFRLAMRAPQGDPDFESRWTTVRRIRLHDRASRKVPPGAMPVVLVHGLAVSHRYLMPLAAQLAPRYPVRAVDLPGFGLSDDPGRVLDVPELADRLAEWLTTSGAAPAALLGNSFGCQVAVDLAVRHPDLVRCLVLVGPTMDPHPRTALRQLLRWLRDLRHEDPFQAPIILRDLADAGPRRALRTFRIALDDPIERKLPAVRVPTLVTRGSLEPVVPQRWAEQATRLLPRGELAVVPGSPHDANYTAAERLAALVVPFLDRVSAQPAG